MVFVVLGVVLVVIEVVASHYSVYFDMLYPNLKFKITLLLGKSSTFPIYFLRTNKIS